VLAGDFELTALVLDFSEKARVLDSQCGLCGKVLSNATSFSANVPVRLRITMSAPTNRSSAMRGTANSARSPICSSMFRTRLS
jgi:hypothetical protein